MAKTKVGKWVQEQRSILGWTRRELSQRSGYTEQHIRNIETGESNPSSRCLISLEASFHLKFEREQ